ncbi:SRPBCC family protein [Streptomyces sp. NPDC051662]|uniref:SRPBCC family protein n=1 Tax=Streptomyces sp. NPDC051662 TaxID=3154750 RepID=UPI003445D55B
MSAFRIDRTSPLSADEVWRRLTDWPAHAGQVPLTRIAVLTPEPTHVGTVFVARTGLGRAGFDDPMEVVRWQPPAPGVPGHCRLEKRGLGRVAKVAPSARRAGPAASGACDRKAEGLPSTGRTGVIRQRGERACRASPGRRDFRNTP